jgi:hypothetical protein
VAKKILVHPDGSVVLEEAAITLNADVVSRTIEWLRQQRGTCLTETSFTPATTTHYPSPITQHPPLSLQTKIALWGADFFELEGVFRISGASTAVKQIWSSFRGPGTSSPIRGRASIVCRRSSRTDAFARPHAPS